MIGGCRLGAGLLTTAVIAVLICSFICIFLTAKCCARHPDPRVIPQSAPSMANIYTSNDMRAKPVRAIVNYVTTPIRVRPTIVITTDRYESALDRSGATVITPGHVITVWYKWWRPRLCHY